MNDALQGPVRRCTSCGREKPITAFQLHRRYRGGRRRQCRNCVSAAQRRWRLLNPALVRAQQRRFRRRHSALRRTPEGGRKHSARMMAFYAVRLGFLPRKHRCEKCGIEDRCAPLYRHHPDYADPLNVVWLCAACHGEAHRKEAG
jgi:hypothetical protein